MIYAVPAGRGCYCPIQTPVCYQVGVATISEERMVLELISKERNVFGDTIYYIRDGRGATSVVYENDLPQFMKKNGVTELKEGSPFKYAGRSK